MESWMPFFVMVTALAVVLQAIVLIVLFLQIRRTAARVEQTMADLNVRLDADSFPSPDSGGGCFPAHLGHRLGCLRTHSSGSRPGAESGSRLSGDDGTAAFTAHPRRSDLDRRHGSRGRSRVAIEANDLGPRRQGHCADSRHPDRPRILPRRPARRAEPVERSRASSKTKECLFSSLREIEFRDRPRRYRIHPPPRTTSPE